MWSPLGLSAYSTVPLCSSHLVFASSSLPAIIMNRQSDGEVLGLTRGLWGFLMLSSTQEHSHAAQPGDTPDYDKMLCAGSTALSVSDTNKLPPNPKFSRSLSSSQPRPREAR